MAGFRILDKLRDDGRIDAIRYESLYHQTKRSGEAVQDALVDSGALSEADMLKFVAGMYQTRFVSTERLAKAEVDRALLDMVPRKVAERLGCVPVVFDRRAQSLSIVVADLEEDVAKQVQLVAGVREVKPYIARPASIRAAIRKYYGNDASAFAKLLPREAPPSTGIDPGFGMAGAGGSAPGLAVRAPAPGAIEIGGLSGLDLELDRGGAPPAAPPVVVPRKAPALGVIPGDIPGLGGSSGTPDPSSLGSFEAAPDFQSYLETVGVFVSLLEQSRAELRGHSTMVARIARKMTERLSLPSADRNAITLAAWLHDVGKMSSYHLTPLNVSRFDGHRLQAQRAHATPGRLFESAKLPETTKAALESLYERWDGQGFPKNLAGSQIPVGARILAMVETYADLVANPKNPYRRVLTHSEATDVVRQLAGQLFDPGMIDPLRLAAASETHKRGLGNRSRVLVVEPDADESMVLELRFEERGYDVAAARSKTDALAQLEKASFDLVVSEVELGAGGDGFALAEALKARPTGAPPVLFFTRRADRDSIARGFALGCADYIAKPAPPDVVLAKAGQALEASLRKKGGGLSGSLVEMGLPEVIQVLGQSRKSGRLEIVSGHQKGELWLEAGLVVHASFGKDSGENAVYAMLVLKAGDFVFDPSARTGHKTMSASTEGLLLEGMRRLDEGLR